MSDLTHEERAVIEARHHSIRSPYWDEGECAFCMEFDGEIAERVKWPCDAARLLADLTAAEARALNLRFGLTEDGHGRHCFGPDEPCVCGRAIGPADDGGQQP